MASTSAPGGAISASATIRLILREANHFDCLGLPKPYADLVGEPAWDGTAEDVNRAFRKRSLHCHPDKSKHPDAPRAFDMLKKAKACLLSDLERDAYIREHVREQQLRWEGSWKSETEAARARERVTTARGSAQQEQAESVAEAMKRRREKAEFAEWRKQRSVKLRAQATYRPDDDDDSMRAMLQGEEDGPVGGDADRAAQRVDQNPAAFGGSRALKKRQRFGV